MEARAAQERIPSRAHSPPDLEHILGKSRLKQFLGRHLLEPVHRPLRRAYEERGVPYTWSDVRRSRKHKLYLLAAGSILGELPSDVQEPVTEYLGLPRNALTVGNIPLSTLSTLESAVWLYAATRTANGDGIDAAAATVALGGIGLYKAATNLLFNPPRFFIAIKDNKAVGTLSGFVGARLLPYYGGRALLRMRRAKRQDGDGTKQYGLAPPVVAPE